VIKRFGGYIGRFMGDGLLVYFGYPEAHEADAENAVRAALARREQEQGAAHLAALRAVESELRNTISGLLLHTQLALREGPPSPQLEQRLRLMAELAGNLKQRLDIPQA